LISAIGIIHDINTAVTMDLKEAGNSIYLVGEFSTEQKSVPDVPTVTPQLYQNLHKAIQNGLVKSCHDLSEGGLAVSAAEMCIGGRLGLELDIEESALFSEVNGCLLVEVAPVDVAAFELQFTNLPTNKIGTVTKDPILKTRESVSISITDLVHAFNTHS
jgi:phosphoribosylformylglycinamidine (FGAM) synthase-like enzyme